MSIFSETPRATITQIQGIRQQSLTVQQVAGQITVVSRIPAPAEVAEGWEVRTR